MGFYRFGPRAEADLQEIGAFTLKHWGELQLERLLSTLYEKLGRYAERPTLGRSRDELHPGLRCFLHEEFVVFYLAVDGGIDVVRVLHGRRDFDSAF